MELYVWLKGCWSSGFTGVLPGPAKGGPLSEDRRMQLLSFSGLEVEGGQTRF